MRPAPGEWAAEEYGRLKSERWLAASDPAAHVGARHHTVPAFCLRRFAAAGKRLAVWRRATGTIEPGTVDDLAIRDFYTCVNTDGQLDGRLEQMLGQVEDSAAAAVRWLLSPFRGRHLNAEQQIAVCQLIAFQLMRSPRKRKEIELLGDYGVKLLDDGSMTETDLRDTTFVPHPNEHIRLIGPVSEAIFWAILRRPIQVIQLDAPLLVICDEPVLIDIDNHVQHLPECALRPDQQSQRHNRNRHRNGSSRQLIHVWPTRPAGVQVADAIAMPVAPNALIALGPIGDPVPPVITISGDEARELASEVNAALLAQAYEWVAASPHHPTFLNWTFPELGPLLGVCDGGSIMSHQLQTAPVLKWQRIRKGLARSGESPAPS